MKFDGRLKICIMTNSHLGMCKRPPHSSTSLDFAVPALQNKGGGSVPVHRTLCTQALGLQALPGVHRRKGGVCVHMRAWCGQRTLSWCGVELGELWRWCWMSSGDLPPYPSCAACCCLTSHFERLYILSQTGEKHEVNNTNRLKDY